MKIAQIAPLYESVPPKCYGGTERVVSYLTEELVRLGHEVTLFASGDSVTSASLEAQCDRALRLDEQCMDHIAHHTLMTEKLYQHADRFDVIHSHIDYFPFPMLRHIPTPSLTTLHGRLDIPDLIPLYQEFRDMPVASISDVQREPLPWINWRGTVYHGLPSHLYSYKEKPGDYLAFLGRVSPEKRVDYAIEIADRTGIPLKIAAKVDKIDQDYFNTAIKPLLNDKKAHVEYIGEIGEKEKNDFLGNAYAFLFPVDWPEPFGLVMIEAMACGTPVVAFRNGSVPEVITEGETGFIIETIEEAVNAVKRIFALSRKRCREVFEEKFTAARMTANYLKIYEFLLLKKL